MTCYATPALHEVRLVVAAILLGSTTLAFAQHTGDVWIGRTADGTLTLSPFGLMPERTYQNLLPAGGPLLFGWSNNDPGFDAVVSPVPGYDIWPLQPGANIWLRWIQGDPAFRMIDGNFQIISQPGQETRLGGPNLHVHNTFHINSLDPAFNPQQCVWRITFRLLDKGSTGYAPTRDLTFNFTNVPWGPGLPPPAGPILPTGDFTGDGVVRAADFHALCVCLGHPDAFPAPHDPAVTSCEVYCANAFDFDIDLDVDLHDVAEFQVLYSGL